METIRKVVAILGASNIDERLEVRLVDIIYSFQEQTTEDQVMLDGFGTVAMLLAFVSNLISHRSSLLFSGGSTTRAQSFDNRPQISQTGWLS